MPKRIFLDPKEFRSEDEAKELFIDRALKVATILKNTGWMLTDPKFDGNSTFEYAIRNSPLTQFLEKGHEKDNDIIMDGSPGCPEAEMTDPDCWEKVQIFANLSTHLMEAQANVAMVVDVQARSGCNIVLSRLDAIDSLFVKEQTKKTRDFVDRNVVEGKHVSRSISFAFVEDIYLMPQGRILEEPRKRKDSEGRIVRTVTFETVVKSVSDFFVFIDRGRPSRP